MSKCDLDWIGCFVPVQLNNVWWFSFLCRFLFFFPSFHEEGWIILPNDVNIRTCDDVRFYFVGLGWSLMFEWASKLYMDTFYSFHTCRGCWHLIESNLVSGILLIFNVWMWCSQNLRFLVKLRKKGILGAWTMEDIILL